MASTALSGKRVLIVEDELLVAMLIEDILIEQGCLISGPVATLTNALHAAQGAVDIAVLDVNLAGIRSYPVAELLSCRGIPFLFLTGYGDRAIPPERPTWRACAKPFEPDGLIAELETLLAR